MKKTADPHVFIEYQDDNTVIYNNLEGKRWSVTGKCDRRGFCMVGAVVDTPDGKITIKSVEHLNSLCEKYEKSRLDSELDVPINTNWKEGTCCPFVVEVLS